MIHGFFYRNFLENYARKDVKERSHSHFELVRNDLEEFTTRGLMDKGWFLYIVECRTKDLYVGIAEDVPNRVDLHNQGRACRYTKFRRPVTLIHQEFCGAYNDARK